MRPDNLQDPLFGAVACPLSSFNWRVLLLSVKLSVYLLVLELVAVELASDIKLNRSSKVPNSTVCSAPVTTTLSRTVMTNKVCELRNHPLR